MSQLPIFGRPSARLAEASGVAQADVNPDVGNIPSDIVPSKNGHTTVLPSQNGNAISIKTHQGKGLVWESHFSPSDPYAGINWELRNAKIAKGGGDVLF